ncbi:hypothetical protein Q5752_006414 [Cryptotrichosporon argae]
MLASRALYTILPLLAVARAHAGGNKAATVAAALAARATITARADASDTSNTVSCVGSDSYAFNGATAACGASMTCDSSVTDGNPCAWEDAATASASVTASASTGSGSSSSGSASGVSCVGTDSYVMNGATSACTASMTCDTYVTAGNPCAHTADAATVTATGASSTTSSSLVAEDLAATASSSASATVTSSSSSSGSGSDDAATVTLSASGSMTSRYVAYWSVYADSAAVPDMSQLNGVTHVILAFANMTSWDGYLYSTDGQFDATTPSTLKAVKSDLKVMAALGGWGEDTPFRPNTAPDMVDAFVTSISTFVSAYDLDGVDIDWEYPVGNGANYELPASDPDARPYDAADATQLNDFLAKLRTSLGDDKIISLAVPSRPEDMLAYNATTMPGYMASLDFINLMSYDFVNRRDTATGYASGISVVEEDLAYYTSFGVDASQINIGFPMYAKWFDLGATNGAACSASAPIGCVMSGFESSDGSDTGLSGTWAFSDVFNTENTGTLNETIDGYWTSIQSGDTSSYENSTAGSSAYFDSDTNWFWTWQSATDFYDTCSYFLNNVGGVMVWSLNQDDATQSGGTHFDALQSCLATSSSTAAAAAGSASASASAS